MSSSQSVSFLLYESFTITFQLVSVLLNGAVVLCTIRKKSLIRCPSTKFVFSLCLSHLLISLLSLVISVIQPFMDNPSSSSTAAASAIISNSITVDGPTLSSSTTTADKTTLHHHHHDSSSSSSSSVGMDHIIQPNSHTHIPHDHKHVQDVHVSHLLNSVILYMTLTVALGTSFTLAVISIERHITIARPMRYKSIITSSRCTLSITFCWFFSILLILSPILFFGNRTETYNETFAIPTGKLGLYFAFLFSCTTFCVLVIMIICYAHIYKIAKEKCQKVQIGHFTSPVSSISSDWPSSVYSSAGGIIEGHHLHHHRHQHHHHVISSTASFPLMPQRLLKPNMTLVHCDHWMPMSVVSNLAKSKPNKRIRSQLTSNVLRLVSSNTTPPPAVHYGSSNKKLLTAAASEPIASQTNNNEGDNDNPSRLKRWTTWLQQNYNSPRKTIMTIILLISSLVVTQIPLCIALFFTPTTVKPAITTTSPVEDGGHEKHWQWISNAGSPALLYFSLRLLFSFSSIINPVLYGFLNRNIRNHLWNFLRLRKASLRKRRQLLYYNFATLPHSPSVKSCRNSINLDDPRKISPIPICKVVAGNEETLVPAVQSSERPDSIKVEVAVDDTMQDNNEKMPLPLPTIKTTIYDDGGDQKHQDNGYRNTISMNQTTFDQGKTTTTKTVSQQKRCSLSDGEEDELDDYDEIMDEELLSLSSFPRKPSQDSGADMAFSEEEDEEGDKDEMQRKQEVGLYETGRRRSKSEICLTIFEFKDGKLRKCNSSTS